MLPGGFAFAVSGTTYYMSFDGIHLFRWKTGTSEWIDTGIKNKGNQAAIDNFSDIKEHEFKLAVSGKTVYVGKRDGKLMQSLDEGDSWNDVTANLSISVDHFKAIIFAEQTVYVATDKGVVRSRDGTDWQTITDAEGHILS